MSDPSPAKVVLQCKDLDKRFQDIDIDVHVLRGVNLHVHAGETLAVVGACAMQEAAPAPHARGTAAGESATFAAGYDDRWGRGLHGRIELPGKHHGRQ